MKKHILIRNTGLAPIESFTILGLSTARGEADRIGQFGSGSKHGILALLRHGITPRIFIGLDELVFSTHPAKMGDKEYDEVRYTFRGEQHKTGMCLEFGGLDWDDATMALREFICNALDQGEKVHQCVLLEDETSPQSDETRIYVPTENSNISGYWDKLREYFLHFDDLQDTPIIPARSENAQFFRRGVYVTERGGVKSTAMFGYNFSSERIDESRNMDGAAMGKIAGNLLRKSQTHLEEVIRSFSGEAKWEHEIGNSVFNWDFTKNAALTEAWKSVHGELPFANNGITQAALVKKGIRFAYCPSSWVSALKYSGIVDGETLLTALDGKQADECAPTESAVETFQRVWRWLEAARLTDGKPFPEVKCFSQPMKHGGETMGFYRDSIVFLNLDYDTNEQTALEELSHYITGAEDETRDFQDFAFKLATRLAKSRISQP